MEEAAADELGSGETGAMVSVELRIPVAQLAGDAGGGGLAVGFPAGEGVPGGDEALAGAGDDGDALRLATAEAFKGGLPVGVGVDGVPGGFNEDMAEVAAAVLGEMAVAVRKTGGVDAWGEAGVADELLGVGKTGDVADGGEEGHGGEEGEAGELDEEGHEVAPGGYHAEASEFGVDGGELRGEMVEGGEIVVRAELFGGGEVELVPPGTLALGEEAAGGGRDGEAVEDAVEAVLGGGALLDEGAAVGEEGAELADGDGGHPDGGDELGGEEAGQLEGVNGIGFDGGVGDPGDVEGVGDEAAADEWGDDVVAPPGVAGGLEDDGVGGAQVLGGP